MNILQLGICNVILTAGTETDTMGKFSKALLNTVVGMGTVFAVLIFIAILIYLIKFIPALVDMFTKQDSSNDDASFAVDQSTTQYGVSRDEALVEELVDDSELVAVITAAIMASMGIDAPADGLFVKSIKRANVKKWQNA